MTSDGPLELAPQYLPAAKDRHVLSADVEAHLKQTFLPQAPTTPSPRRLCWPRLTACLGTHTETFSHTRTHARLRQAPTSPTPRRLWWPRLTAWTSSTTAYRWAARAPCDFRSVPDKYICIYIWQLRWHQGAHRVTPPHTTHTRPTHEPHNANTVRAGRRRAAVRTGRS